MTKKFNTLSPEEESVIVHKGTEYAFKGAYVNNHGIGTYSCKRCNAPLFKSNSKFDSGSGWPAFDDMIGNSVQEILDTDGLRTEIVCNNCKAHLGHVFSDGPEPSGLRYCVNSESIKIEKNSNE